MIALLQVCVRSPRCVALSCVADCYPHSGIITPLVPVPCMRGIHAFCLLLLVGPVSSQDSHFVDYVSMCQCAPRHHVWVCAWTVRAVARARCDMPLMRSRYHIRHRRRLAWVRRAHARAQLARCGQNCVFSVLNAQNFLRLRRAKSLRRSWRETRASSGCEVCEKSVCTDCRIA